MGFGAYGSGSHLGFRIGVQGLGIGLRAPGL